MALPRIIFKEMTLKENIDVIKWAFFDNNGPLSVHDFTIKCFPQLANLDFNMPKGEIYKIIEEVVTNDYNKYKDRIISETERYNNLWEHYNDSYLKTLSSYFNIEWPNNLKEINATVGLIPVFPRYLDDFSFSIGTGVDESKLLEVCAHETLHFLWFEKWKQVHPETPRREYDSPYPNALGLAESLLRQHSERHLPCVAVQGSPLPARGRRGRRYRGIFPTGPS